MGKWLYRKPEPTTVRGVCVKCGKHPQKRKSGGYKSLCTICDNDKSKNYKQKANNSYRKYLKSCCELCGFVPTHRCQLDIDHIDGNHHNNDRNNLQTLCANCHRLKTYQNQEYNKKAPGVSSRSLSFFCLSVKR